MIDQLLSYVAPHSCCGCGEIGTVLCDYCKDDIIQEPFSQCIGCLRPTSGDNLCSSCSDYWAEQAWCVASRENKMKTMLDAYKFDGVKAAAPSLVSLLDAALPLLPKETVVTCVPTASAHIRVRGYDHMRLIAKGLARQRGLTYRPLLNRQTVSTQHFMKSRQERQEAAEHAFTLTETTIPTRVLLLDDIVTTGATMKAAARLLHDAGAKQLMIGVMARQLLE